MVATVAVPGPVRRQFAYEVPPGLAALCVPGARVVVPFGRRKVTGYVVGVGAEPPAEAASLALKPIERVLDDVPALDAPLLDLTRWAADYYAASWGEMIRAALPGLQAPVRREAVLTAAGRDTLARARRGGHRGPGAPGETARAVLAALEAGAGGADAPMSVAEIRRRAGCTVSLAALRRMAGRGWLSIREVVTGRGLAPRLETRVRAAGVPGEGTPGAPGGRPPGPRQAAILERLSRAPEGLLLPDLLRETGGTRAGVDALARRGLVRLETRRAERTPLALRPGVEAVEPVHVLTPAQAAAAGAVAEAVRGGRFATFLLHGVTGSGKTEVYLRAIEATLAAGRAAVYLVPEIGLTPLLARRMQARFGETLALLHSGLSEGERHDQWRRAREGKVRVVLGARSAVFAPLAAPGILIVDEEHDASYKQDEHPRYNGRDLAIVRARATGSVALLGSATPSMESWHHALQGKYRLLALPERVGGAALPAVRRVDMRREFEEVGRESILSRALVTALRARLDRGEQSLILLNRRGFSTFAVCRACGKPLECRSCSIALTLHLRERRLRCHYCNESRAVPGACPACGGPLHFGGTGTERLEEMVRSFLPGARVERMDRDTVRGRGAVEGILWRVERGEVDVLLGTQMIAKGHDFPNVTLVGVLAADALLGMPDFRAGERTFQLLAQVAGRSGRRERPGEVIVQAWDPDHHAVRAACEHDFASFARAELAYRRTLGYPPYAALALLIFRDRAYEKAATHAAAVAAALRRLGLPDLQVLGPAPAPLERLRGAFRIHVLLKARGRGALRRAIDAGADLIERRRLGSDAVTLDVDPISTL